MMHLPLWKGVIILYNCHSKGWKVHGRDEYFTIILSSQGEDFIGLITLSYIGKLSMRSNTYMNCTKKRKIKRGTIYFTFSLRLINQLISLMYNSLYLPWILNIFDILYNFGSSTT